MNAYHVEPIPRSLMASFVAAHHYAVRVPPHCLLSLGCFAGSDLVGVAPWGFAASMCGVKAPGQDEKPARQRKRYTQEDLRRKG